MSVIRRWGNESWVGRNSRSPVHWRTRLWKIIHTKPLEGNEPRQEMRKQHWMRTAGECQWRDGSVMGFRDFCPVFGAATEFFTGLRKNALLLG